MSNDNTLLVVAIALGAAAFLLAEDNANASSGAPVTSGSNNNGFAINNPGNIKWSSANNWQGQIGQQNGFVVFDTLANGVRALGILLTNYFSQGYQTITAIITHYEGGDTVNNNIPAYITNVSNDVGEPADSILSWPQDEVALIQAIAHQENGYNNMADSDVASYVGQ